MIHADLFNRVVRKMMRRRTGCNLRDCRPKVELSSEDKTQVAALMLLQVRGLVGLFPVPVLDFGLV